MKKLFSILGMVCLGLAAQAQSYVQMFVTAQPCNNDGIVTAVATNLTTPLTFSWNVGGTTVIHSGVNSLSDQITSWSGVNTSVGVTDANGLYVSMVNFASPPFNVAANTTPALCPALGTGTALASGGATPYNYSWTDLGGNVVASGPSVTLAGGSYHLLVTDMNGCTVMSGTDSGSNGIYVEESAPFYPMIATTTASCTNGTATVNLSGSGTAPYTYVWSNGATSTSLNNLMMGAYSVVVTDAQGCHATGWGYVEQNPYIQVNANTTPATCLQNDGASIVFGSGGTPPYTYLWSNGATGQSLTNVPSDFYTVYITDANGCIGNGGVWISASTPITATYSATPSQCTTANGTATVAPAGGTTPYSIAWNTYPAQTGTTATGLSAGSYGFTITDAMGCVRTGSAVVNPIVQLNISASGSQPVCPATTGSASVSASGGSGYSYLWSNGATTSSITGVPLGGYSVTVTDVASGCAKSASAVVVQTSPVVAGISTSPASCIFNADGQATATGYGGTAPYNYSWSNGTSGSTVTGLSTGGTYVTVTDVNGCSDWTYATIGYNANNNSCYCTLTGQVYEDLNSNCAMDAGENGIQNIQVHAAGMGGGYDYTDATGHYSMIVPTGSYTLSESVQAFYPLSACQNNAITISANASTGCVITNNFANAVNPIHDIHLITTNLSNPPIPGFDYYQKVVVSNQGTVNENNIVAGHLSDGQLGAGSFSPSIVFVSDGANHHSASGLSLAPAASYSDIVTYNVPTNIPLGTGLVFKDSAAYDAPMSNWLSDYSPWNNTDYYTPIVVGSYDPNYKEVSPRGTGNEGTILAADSVLEYTVHFQNLGTYAAQNIYVLDTLDADLDWSSLRPIYLSHAGSVTISEQGVLKANFPDIMLPPKQNEPILSNGMFTYTIKRKHNLPVGTTFTNSAAIYFDFNAPVITNTTLNTLGEPTAVETPANAANTALRVYPNPATDRFTAEVFSTYGGIGTLAISNAQGQVVASAPATVRAGKNALPVDVKKLAAGVYFVTFSDGQTSQSGKLILVK